MSHTLESKEFETNVSMALPEKARLRYSSKTGKVYTEVVPDCDKETQQGVIRGKVSHKSIIHSYKWRGYNGLLVQGYKKHYQDSQWYL